MTPASFDALSRLLRHRPDSQARELVRLVLVDGLTQADAARQLGATEQAASNALRAARATLELARVAVCPVTGWEGKSNQHERDGAMVAWQYRMAGG